MIPSFADELAELISKYRELPGHSDEDIVADLLAAITEIEEGDAD